MNTVRPKPGRNFFANNMTLRQLVTHRAKIAGIGVVVMALLALGWTTLDEPAADQPLPEGMAVEVRRMVPVDSFMQERSYTGMVQAERSSDLSFERTAKLIEVAVEEGDLVEGGQILARLDLRHLEARQRELTARRDQAKAVLAELVAGPRKEVIAVARAEVRDLKSQLDLSRANYHRQERLRRSSAISREEFDQTLFGLRSVQARLDAAQRRLDELLAGTRSEQVDAQKAAVAQLEAMLADVDIDIKDSTLVAPFAGRIAVRHVDEGTVISPGTPILRIVEDHELEAWIGLPPESAARFDVGASLQVKVGGQPYPVVVDSILPELDRKTRTRTVVLAFNSSAAHRVVPGEVVRIEVAASTAAQGYWLPTTALIRGHRGLWSALAVVTDADGKHTAARRDVEVLYTEGARVLVRGTIQPGDRIIVEGTHRIAPGQQVQPME